MYDSDYILRPQQPQSDNATLFVSLYVVLLAFFIMLNVISEHDEDRRQEVIDSVKETFTIPEKLRVGKFEHEDISLNAVEQFYGELQKTLEMLVKLGEVEIIRSGGTMMATLPTRLLFEDETTVIRPLTMPFMEVLATLLKKWQPDLRLEMEFLIGYEGMIAGGSEREMRLEMQRSGVFARFFEQRNISGKSLVIGMREDYPGVIIITFNAREPAKARIEVSSPDGANGEEKHE